MSVRRAALLLGSAGLHAAVLALLALVAVKAGFRPVLVVHLSAWEAVTVRPAVAAPPLRLGSDGGPARRMKGMRWARSPGPPSVETAADASMSGAPRPRLHSQDPGDASESAPSRAREGSATAEQPPERHGVALERPPAAPLEDGAREHSASGTRDAVPGGPTAAAPSGPGALAAAGHGGAASAGPGAAGSPAAWASGGGRDGSRGLGLSGGSRVALVGSGDGRGGVPPEYGPYLARFRQRVQDALVFPLAARRRGLSGAVELDVLIDAAGKVEKVEVASSSSHAMLDEAALETVREMAPLPLPETLPARPLRVKLPLVFELR
ncbi:MAG: energy transducer TonB [Candidatus Rokubacteria bacterium]|nr:energy transducer TonB [Candidatus Rokubacteria bacterium]